MAFTKVEGGNADIRTATEKTNSGKMKVIWKLRKSLEEVGGLQKKQMKLSGSSCEIFSNKKGGKEDYL